MAHHLLHVRIHLVFTSSDLGADELRAGVGKSSHRNLKVLRRRPHLPEVDFQFNLILQSFETMAEFLYSCYTATCVRYN
jgi:hypothetical protein